MKVKILLVEDDAVAQMVLVHQFHQCGGCVDLAGTGAQAMDKFSRGDYDFILMDIRLPETNGFELTRAIRATVKGKTIPIIGITAYALFCVEQECRAAGMNDVIAKPCSYSMARTLIATYSSAI